MNRCYGKFGRRSFLKAVGCTGALGIPIFVRHAHAHVSQEKIAGKSIEYSKETHVFKVAGDCKIRADVFRAPSSGVQPVIVWIHGGALISGHRGNINTNQLERYLAKGCTVVSIDYRLAPEEKLKAIIEDVQDAFRWVRQKGPDLFGVNPDRLAVIGHSAGGYLTQMTGFCVTPRPKALVSFYGYGDIAGAWYSRPDPHYSQQPAVPKEEAYAAVGGPVKSEAPGPDNRFRFYLYCRQQGLWPKEVSGYDPDQNSKAYDPFCPVRNVSKDYPPTLLLHGDKDTDVPYEQSVMMAKRLSELGVEHELITIPGGGHGFDRRLSDPVVSKAFERVLTFLQQHLK